MGGAFLSPRPWEEPIKVKINRFGYGNVENIFAIAPMQKKKSMNIIQQNIFNIYTKKGKFP